MWLDEPLTVWPTELKKQIYVFHGSELFLHGKEDEPDWKFPCLEYSDLMRWLLETS